MPEKIKFEKVYTRDTSFIPQELWFNVYQGKVAQVLGKNPYYPLLINYMCDGAIEIWENKKAVEWVSDRLFEKNKADKDFLLNTIEEHKKYLEQIKPYWDRGFAVSLKDLQNFIKITYEANYSFVIFYLSVLDERTPKKLREVALKLRENDVFYEKTDKTIRNTLLRLYPELKGYETTLLSKELGKPFPAKHVLEQRKKASILIPDNYFENITLEEFAKQNPKYIFNILQIQKEVRKREFSGQSAYKGSVMGIVRILRRKDQIKEVKEGDIIVSPMTTPDYLPAMKKAAAFVTDEGGITCHAAIVARELKKPCITGTRIATQVLKDGDEIEVDADKGIVRILEREK